MAAIGSRFGLPSRTSSPGRREVRLYFGFTAPTRKDTEVAAGGGVYGVVGHLAGAVAGPTDVPAQDLPR